LLAKTDHLLNAYPLLNHHLFTCPLCRVLIIVSLAKMAVMIGPATTTSVAMVDIFVMNDSSVMVMSFRMLTVRTGFYSPGPLRLDFPRFESDNPAGWMYKANQFFEYYQSPLYQRVRMASFHMEGEALIWFRDADESEQFSTWDTFVKALLT
jgi:hypothetical protein